MPTYAITGSNGFIASHVVGQLLEQGLCVRATVRHDKEAPQLACLRTLAAAHPGKLDVVKVEDLNDTAALAAAFRGCDGVFHMAATHPKYGFEDTPEGRATLVASAVEGTLSALKACVTAGVKRVVLTSSLAAVECGNDEGTLTEGTWSKPEVYDSVFNLKSTQWATHFTYVKSKTEQEKAAVAFAAENSLDLRVVVPGNLCVGPIANKAINGTMTRLRDIMAGNNTLKGAADLGVVHVLDVAAAHTKAMTVDDASGRYLVSPDMVQTGEIHQTLQALFPAMKVAKLDNMNMASGVPGQARKIDASRSVAELGLQLRDLKTTLKDAVESMVANGHVRATPATRVLHLLGSPASSYYEKLSVMYAQGCVASNVEPCAAEGYDFAYAVVHPEGPSWSFPADLSADAMASAPRLDNGSGLARLAALGADVCQSHMFCVQGVSTYRAILDLLNVPYLGGSVDAMTLTTHKGRSRDVVLAAGVPCAEGEVLRHGASPSMAPPYVLKPCSEDNSMGISLVMEPSQAEAALEKAYSFDDEVLCERFVPPGRELRVAVIEDENGVPATVLPVMEYFMTNEKPIRTSDDKLTSDKNGQPTAFAKPSRQCPADIDDVLMAKLAHATKLAHTALGCRDYSLYDFRVDPAGEIFFLEASLFCCFAPNSVISLMGDHSGLPEMAHRTLFQTLLRRAADRKMVKDGPQTLGSKPKKAKTTSSSA